MFTFQHFYSGSARTTIYSTVYCELQQYLAKLTLSHSVYHRDQKLLWAAHFLASNVLTGAICTFQFFFFFCIFEQLSFEKNCVAPSNSEVSVEHADHHMRQLIPFLFRTFLIVSASLLPYLLLIYSAKDDCGTFSGKINSFPAPTFVLHIHRPH